MKHTTIFENAENLPIEITESKQTVYTGFRPSAPESKKDIGAELTLGHLLQVEQLKTLSKVLTAKDSTIYCVIADVQGNSDNRSVEHYKRMKKYEKIYMDGLYSAFGDTNIIMYRESTSQDIVSRFSLELANYIGFIDYLDLSQEKEQKIRSNLGVGGSLRKVLQSTLFQTGSIAGAGASIVPGGRDQMGTVDVYNIMLKNLERKGIDFGITQCIGISNETMLVGLDGKIMSTSKGNYIDISMGSDLIKQKLHGAKESFLISFIEGFTDSEKKKIFYALKSGERKDFVIELIIELLSPIQERRQLIDEEEICEKIDSGSKHYANTVKNRLKILTSLFV